MAFRIGIDARMLGSAPGIGRYIECLTHELFLQDQENEYVMFLREPAYSSYPALEFQRGSASGEVPRGSARIWKMRAPERWYSFSEQLTLPIRFARARLDLLFVPQFNVPLWTPCPFVVTIHDVTQLYMPGPLQAQSGFRQRAFRRVFSSAAQRARAIIAVSKYTKGEIVERFGGNPQKIHVIYEGPGLAPEAREAPNPKHEIRNGSMGSPSRAAPRDKPESFDIRYSIFDIPHGEYLLAVGVWRPHKNFLGLLEAFAEMRKNPKFSSTKLVLVGEEDPRYPEVKDRIRTLNIGSHVVAAGRVSDEELHWWYQNARAVAVPSFYEGFGFVGLEALRFNVPVAASNTGAIPEILGDAACYFDPHDVRAMAEALSLVLRDEHERQRIFNAAPAVLVRYSWERAARETLQLFMEHKT